MRGRHVLVMITCNMICSLPSLRIFEDSVFLIFDIFYYIKYVSADIDYYFRNASLGSFPSDSLSKDTNKDWCEQKCEQKFSIHAILFT